MRATGCAAALLCAAPAVAQIAFSSSVEAKDCCAGKCGITGQVLNFPATGHPGFEFNITGTLPKQSDTWHLELHGTVEGAAILLAKTAGCGKVTTPLGPPLLPAAVGAIVGQVEIDFPACPVPAGDVVIKGKVTLRIPIPYGFGAAVSVHVYDGADETAPLLSCETVNVASKMLPPPPVEGAHVVVGGDSWGSFGAQPFAKMFTRHGSNATVYNMAAGGTTSADWSAGPILEALVKAVSEPTATHVWMTFGGNDAIEHLPFCALTIDPKTGTNKTIDACTDELLNNVTVGIDKTLAAVKAANPKIRVVGFGYDIMGLSKLPICPFFPRAIMPQCFNKKAHPEGSTHCFNQQFLKIQGVWDMYATTPRGLGIVDTVNLLGTLQAAGGDSKASTGHPDLDKFGVSKLWQINCIHPSEDKGSQEGGFSILFDKFWDLYWSKQNI